MSRSFRMSFRFYVDFSILSRRGSLENRDAALAFPLPMAGTFTAMTAFMKIRMMSPLDWNRGSSAMAPVYKQVPYKWRMVHQKDY